LAQAGQIDASRTTRESGPGDKVSDYFRSSFDYPRIEPFFPGYTQRLAVGGHPVAERQVLIELDVYDPLPGSRIRSGRSSTLVAPMNLRISAALSREPQQGFMSGNHHSQISPLELLDCRPAESEQIRRTRAVVKLVEETDAGRTGVIEEVHNTAHLGTKSAHSLFQDVKPSRQ
jgi:hypothetical protein